MCHLHTPKTLGRAYTQPELDESEKGRVPLPLLQPSAGGDNANDREDGDFSNTRGGGWGGVCLGDAAGWDTRIGPAVATGKFNGMGVTKWKRRE